jgi:hypothetical protein
MEEEGRCGGSGLADEGDFDVDTRFLYVRNRRKKKMAGLGYNAIMRRR